MLKKLLFFLLSLFTLLYACRRDDDILEDPSASLNFSSDSIHFDTVFTTVGSITENFRVYNPYKEIVRINSIRLKGGQQSAFRINVDGRPGTYHEGIEIAAKDSMWVFVEVTIDPNNDQNPFVIEDAIEFNVNGKTQEVHLVAWGQNAIYFTPTSFNKNLPDFTCLTGPCSDNTPPVDVVWTDSLPYVVYDYVAIDSLDKLTIKAGSRVYFHNNGGMWVYRGGTLKVEGSKDKPVIFRGDRLEKFYEDVPGQWDRIWINEGGNHEINYAVIRNAFIGIQAEGLFLNSPPTYLGSLSLKNTIIDNCSGFGLLSAAFNVSAENLLVSNCGEYNVALQALGSYHFDHCTFANYFDAASRETPLFFTQNTFRTALGVLVDTPSVRLRNSIVLGNKDNEFDTEIIDNGSIDLHVENTILKTTINTSNTSQFINIIKNPTQGVFNQPAEGNFELSVNSPAINAGLPSVGNLVPLDLQENSRTADGQPDLGVYEFIP
jgi:hypothetical protein